MKEESGTKRIQASDEIDWHFTLEELPWVAVRCVSDCTNVEEKKRNECREKGEM